MNRVQILIFKITILIVLIFGAIAPSFRGDAPAKWANVISVSVLAVLAGLGLWRADRPK